MGSFFCGRKHDNNSGHKKQVGDLLENLQLSNKENMEPENTPRDICTDSPTWSLVNDPLVELTPTVGSCSAFRPATPYAGPQPPPGMEPPPLRLSATSGSDSGSATSVSANLMDVMEGEKPVEIIDSIIEVAYAVIESLAEAKNMEEGFWTNKKAKAFFLSRRLELVAVDVSILRRNARDLMKHYPVPESPNGEFSPDHHTRDTMYVEDGGKLELNHVYGTMHDNAI